MYYLQYFSAISYNVGRWIYQLNNLRVAIFVVNLEY